MIKYCFCFFLCVLTINGAYESEEAGEKTNKIVLRSQPSSSCHPFFYLEEFQPPKNLRITIICNPSTGLLIQFDSPFKLAKYLHTGGAFSPLKIRVESDIAEDLANLSELLLPLVSLETPSPGQKFRLNPRSKTDRNLMNLALTLSLRSITTPLDTSIQEWKMNTLLKAFDELWSHLSTERTTKRNYELRNVLTRVVDPCNQFEFEKCFQQAYPALTAWAALADKNNTSRKPTGAVITILLMLACTEWQAPPPVPTLILPFQIRNSVSLTNIASITNDGCMMSSRRAALLKKRQGSQRITSFDDPLGANFSNADRRAKFYDEMRNNRKSTMPRSPSEGTPSPFSSTFSLLPTIDATDTDGFYIGDNDDSDDGTV